MLTENCGAVVTVLIAKTEFLVTPFVNNVIGGGNYCVFLVKVSHVLIGNLIAGLNIVDVLNRHLFVLTVVGCC